MSWRRVSLAVVLVAGTIAVAWFAREPSYRGRTLHGWLMDLDDQHPGLKNDAATDAVRHIGRKALPEIISMLESRDSSFRQQFLKWLSDHHVAKSAYAPVLENHHRAVLACRAIGPEAKSAIPALVALLNSGYARGYVGAALRSIGPESVVPLLNSLTNNYLMVRSEVARTFEISFDPRNAVDPARFRSSAPLILPAMLKCLQDSAPIVRNDAARCLGNIGQQPATVVPALLGLLASEKGTLARCNVCLAIGQFKQQAHSAIGPLFNALNDADPCVRGTAAIALARIETKNSATVEKVMPLLITDLTGIEGANPEFRLNYQWPAIEALGECGSQARPAVPALLECLKSVPPFMHKDIVESLEAIDPAAAAKVGVE